MSNAASIPLEFYRTRFEVENNLTRSVLRPIPPDKLDYRPHERSPSTGQIAWTILRGLFIRIDMALQGSSDVVLEFHPSFEEILDRFEDASRRHAASLCIWGRRTSLSPRQRKLRPRQHLPARQTRRSTAIQGSVTPSPKTSQRLRSAKSICYSGERRRRATGARLSVLSYFACDFPHGDLRTACPAMPWTSRHLSTSSSPATLLPRHPASSRLRRRSEPRRCRSTGAPEGCHSPPDGAQPEPP